MRNGGRRYLYPVVAALVVHFVCRALRCADARELLPLSIYARMRARFALPELSAAEIVQTVAQTFCACSYLCTTRTWLKHTPCPHSIHHRALKVSIHGNIYPLAESTLAPCYEKHFETHTFSHRMACNENGGKNSSIFSMNKTIYHLVVYTDIVGSTPNVYTLFMADLNHSNSRWGNQL